MNSLTIPVFHPAFDKLKRSGRLLHFIAAIIIISHAISHINQPDSSQLYFWCQVILAADIFLLVFLGRNILATLPTVNLFFRFVEFLLFLGIGILLMLKSSWVPGAFHAGVGVMYAYLLYCELRVNTEERLSLHHTGITIPALPESKFLLWSNINRLHAQYDSIEILTSDSKKIRFQFRRNLQFEELDQIHEFCRHYLGEESR
ncbi:MAG TPA: hypothetical protein VD993_03260 [Chitinophagaceae bacterium]|nr:hypothetical protein [Chitinophagaceae bacterium]